MKTPRWFTRPNSVLSYLRIAIAGALVTTAVGMAFIATKTSGPSSAPDMQALLRASKPDRDALLLYSKRDRDEFKIGKNAEAMIGPNEYRAGYYTPEVESWLYARAYPATSVSPDRVFNAQKGWAKFKAANATSTTSTAQKFLGKNTKTNNTTNAAATAPNTAKMTGIASMAGGDFANAGGTSAINGSTGALNDPTGVWTPIGPSKGTYPGVLNVLGDFKDYVASGRVTALAIGPNCKATGCSNLDKINAAKCFEAPCTLYLAAAGGGIWKTNNAFSPTPIWTFVSGSFGTNAIGSIKLAPSDPTGNTIYVGTGEPNASADSESGVGVYKSTDGGASWALFPGTGIFFQRSIGQMDFDNAGNLLVPIASGVRDVDETGGGAQSSGNAAHPLPLRGLYRCNGVSCTLIFAAPTPFTRGSTTVKADPTHAGIIYVNAFGGNFFGPGTFGGIWRSIDNGISFQQIFAPIDASATTTGSALERDEFDVNTVQATGGTRMYVGAGTYPPGSGIPAQFLRSDNADTAATFTNLTNAFSSGYCTSQCWYDNFVYTPKGWPNLVYLLGSFTYSQIHGASNGRAVLLSGNAGVNWSDWTQDAGVPHSEFTHPDQHAIVVNPNNPFQYWEGNDGGVIRSNGEYGDISARCTMRGLSAANVAYCQALLSLVPQQLTSINAGLSTFQFQSLSIIPGGAKLQGGTQDNGTFQFVGLTDFWPQEIYGDGGQSGFARANSLQRFNTFTGQANDVNFRDGAPTFWCVASAPILSSPEGSFFYPPLISDPVAGQTIYQGSFSVWRTTDWAGPQASLEANCPEFTTSAVQPGCGDFVIIGDGAPSTRLTSGAWGGRSGSAVSTIARELLDANELWASTGAGRLFVSDNGNAAAGLVHWFRLDDPGAGAAGGGFGDPTRYISGVYPFGDTPAIGFPGVFALVSYSGYGFNTPGFPGHVFEVIRIGGVGTSGAIWLDFSFNLPDFPITSVVLDTASTEPTLPPGDHLVIYASSDFGVMKYVDGSGVWVNTSATLPMVEVPKLTIDVGARALYAATHGRSAWVFGLR